MIGAIAPRGPHANDPAVQAGLRIAQQNCFRCHNMGDGRRGKVGAFRGMVLSPICARKRRIFLRRMCATRRPRIRRRRCPAIPSFDDATMSALTAYFQTFSTQAKPMTLRACKYLLIFAVAIFYSFVVLNNLDGLRSDYQFVRHVLMMDTTFPGNRGMWRADEFGPVAYAFIYRSSRGRW